MSSISSVAYIPSQLDGSAGTDPVMLRDSPLKLLRGDIRHGARHIWALQWIFRPIRTQTKSKASELALERGNIFDILFHVILISLALSILGLGLVLGLVAPASLLLIYYVMCTFLVLFLCRSLNSGPRVLHSTVNLEGYPSRPDERWIFVNGICAGTRWLQENINLISTVFGRPVSAIHNRTFGAIFDLLECIVQRDFLYGTNDTRAAYNHLKQVLLDPSIKRVVVLAHSQGGIIVSSVLEALYADTMPEAFDKLEIYTFGCAATRFCNPPRAIPDSAFKDGKPPPVARQIAAIEHYANEKDFVARIGVLRFVRGIPENQYVGKVFIRQNEGGHMFNQHYLESMFFGEDPPFLKTPVTVEQGIAIKRAAWESADPELGAVRGAAQSQDAAGKTVAELSRLWRYKGGNCPPPLTESEEGGSDAGATVVAESSE